MPFHLSSEPEEAARALAAGHLAVIPTETVYGLGANADDAHAVARVFAVKGRPTDHPLIAHVRDAQAARAWVASIPEYAQALASQLWPGPLTLVLDRSDRAADYLTGGQDTVAVRVPGSPVTREVLRSLAELLDEPSVAIAAPSANRFGRVSPTTAQHASEEIAAWLDDDDVILDAGPCVVGVESTIVDCTGSNPVILRPGKVTPEMIRTISGRELGQHSQTRAPGTLAAHYSPTARVRISTGDEIDQLPPDERVGIIAPATFPTPNGVVRLTAPHSDEEYAASLYRALREADSLGLHTVVAVPPQGEGLADAIRDRLHRAAHRSFNEVAGEWRRRA